MKSIIAFAIVSFSMFLIIYCVNRKVESPRNNSDQQTTLSKRWKDSLYRKLFGKNIGEYFWDMVQFDDVSSKKDCHFLPDFR